MEVFLVDDVYRQHGGQDEEDHHPVRHFIKIEFEGQLVKEFLHPATAFTGCKLKAVRKKLVLRICDGGRVILRL